MTEAAASTTPVPHRGSVFGRLGVALGFLSPALIVVGALGARFGLLAPTMGFGVSTFGAGAAALIGFGLGLAGMISSLTAKPRGGLRTPSVAIALCGLLLAIYAAWATQARRQPPIHDVATDWREPLTPSPQLLAARGDAANPVEPAPTVAAVGGKRWAGQSVAQVNARTCPGAVPVILAEPVDKAFTRVRAALKAERLAIVSEDVRQGRLEATATSAWYRFKDDVIVRVRPEGAGTRIDIRSISRMGASDLGVNCSRVSRLRQALAG